MMELVSCKATQLWEYRIGLTTHPWGAPGSQCGGGVVAFLTACGLPIRKLQLKAYSVPSYTSLLNHMICVAAEKNISKTIKKWTIEKNDTSPLLY
jgi:hypothetical protein